QADSELSRLNRAPGRAVRVSETLWRVTRLALQAAAESDGIITPTILDALEAAGYDHSLSDLEITTPSPPGLATMARPRDVPHWRNVRMDARRRTILLAAGTRLDLAGVAKGWAAEQAVRYLGRTAPALVEASGDIAVSRPRADGSGWAIEIEHPYGRSQDLPLLLLAEHGVATSTRAYRRWLRGDRWQHHLIDPRTGLPAETDVFSATAVAPTLAQAEVAAKVALILGSERGMKWIEERPNLAALLILENGAVQASRRLQDYCWRG
ncbi:MAG: FAD:protein FMN transferase, partial [Rudaea sp.]